MLAEFWTVTAGWVTLALAAFWMAPLEGATLITGGGAVPGPTQASEAGSASHPCNAAEKKGWPFNGQHGGNCTY